VNVRIDSTDYHGEGHGPLSALISDVGFCCRSCLSNSWGSYERFVVRRGLFMTHLFSPSPMP
jgi:hypothetical protein